MADKKYLKRLSDYDAIPATEYLIEPYVPIGALVFVAGLPKTFKTYLSGIDWGYSVATGRKWLGRPTMKGRVAYFALEGYQGVLRRAEAWRLFYKLSKAEGNGLAYITDRISFAEKTCSVDHHFTTLYNASYRPDLVIIDTWFKVTAGAEVGGQVDMSVALKNLRSFQDRLTEWKVEGGLPAVTFVVIAHTDKKGQALFGSITQFADCDVLYQLERVPHANQATLECIGTRDIEDPPTITFEMEKVEIVTANGKEFNLVVSKEVEAGQQDTEAKTNKTGKEQRELELDDLMWITALNLSRPPERLIQYSAWFELTKANRSGKLGTGTFSEAVKRLLAKGAVRKVGDFYQVVLGADADEAAATSGPGGATSGATFTSRTSAPRGREVPEVEVTTSEVTSEVPEVNSSLNGIGKDSIVPDAAKQESDAGHDAVEQLLKGKG
jgi:hypothetical protein